MSAEFFRSAFYTRGLGGHDFNAELAAHNNKLASGLCPLPQRYNAAFFTSSSFFVDSYDCGTCVQICNGQNCTKVVLVDKATAQFTLSKEVAELIWGSSDPSVAFSPERIQNREIQTMTYFRAVEPANCAEIWDYDSFPVEEVVRIVDREMREALGAEVDLEGDLDDEDEDGVAEEEKEKKDADADAAAAAASGDADPNVEIVYVEVQVPVEDTHVEDVPAQADDIPAEDSTAEELPVEVVPPADDSAEPVPQDPETEVEFVHVLARRDHGSDSHSDSDHGSSHNDKHGDGHGNSDSHESHGEESYGSNSRDNDRKDETHGESPDSGSHGDLKRSDEKHDSHDEHGSHHDKEDHSNGHDSSSSHDSHDSHSDNYNDHHDQDSHSNNHHSDDQSSSSSNRHILFLRDVYDDHYNRQRDHYNYHSESSDRSEYPHDSRDSHHDRDRDYDRARHQDNDRYHERSDEREHSRGNRDYDRDHARQREEDRYQPRREAEERYQHYYEPAPQYEDPRYRKPVAVAPYPDQYAYDPAVQRYPGPVVHYYYDEPAPVEYYPPPPQQAYRRYPVDPRVEYPPYEYQVPAAVPVARYEYQHQAQPYDAYAPNRGSYQPEHRYYQEPSNSYNDRHGEPSRTHSYEQENHVPEDSHHHSKHNDHHDHKSDRHLDSESDRRDEHHHSDEHRHDGSDNDADHDHDREHTSDSDSEDQHDRDSSGHNSEGYNSDNENESHSHILEKRDNSVLKPEKVKVVNQNAKGLQQYSWRVASDENSSYNEGELEERERKRKEKKAAHVPLRFRIDEVLAKQEEKKRREWEEEQRKKQGGGNKLAKRESDVEEMGESENKEEEIEKKPEPEILKKTFRDTSDSSAVEEESRIASKILSKNPGQPKRFGLLRNKKKAKSDSSSSSLMDFVHNLEPMSLLESRDIGPGSEKEQRRRKKQSAFAKLKAKLGFGGDGDEEEDGDMIERLSDGKHVQSPGRYISGEAETISFGRSNEEDGEEKLWEMKNGKFVNLNPTTSDSAEDEKKQKLQPRSFPIASYMEPIPSSADPEEDLIERGTDNFEKKYFGKHDEVSEGIEEGAKKGFGWGEKEFVGYGKGGLGERMRFGRKMDLVKKVGEERVSVERE